jgi:hypothetical protein
MKREEEKKEKETCNKIFHQMGIFKKKKQMKLWNVRKF